MKRIIMGIIVVLALAGCDTFTAAPYGISADNDVALKSALGTQRIGVEAFTAATPTDPGCRLAGPIQLPGGLTFAGYIQKAFADELKVAGLYDEKAPIIIRGAINELKFSSSSGTWDIALTVVSSNGKSLTVAEHYDFHTSYSAVSACHNAADAFQPAVQSLVGKVIAAPDFRSLLKN
jgi:hypothetical protein